VKISSGSPESDQVTVVIATRDRCEELLRTLGRMIDRAPMIVVDNGSRDDTVSAVRREYPSVRIVALPANRGAAARNVGVRLAKTPFVAFCDDDSWWAPGALAHAAEVLDRHAGLGLVAARTLVGPHETLDPVSAAMAASPLRRDTDFPGVPVLGFLACAAVVRRSAFLRVGGFSPLLFFTAEEMLLAYDLASAGFALAYLDDLVAHHHPSARRGSPAVRHRLEMRNRLLISWMRRPPVRASVDTVRLARLAAVSADAAASFGSALLRLPWALLARRRLPAQVEGDIVLLEGEVVPT
jgi:GT2 family glycosyltransferase